MSDGIAALAERLERMEAIDAIRQLASKYALALDMRDLDALVGLYVEDVRVSSTESGRLALKQSFATVVRAFTTSAHHIGGHVIEFDAPDRAHGIVYCRCEHEASGQWLPMYMYYLDLYSRVDGRWYFKRRAPSELYLTPVDRHPVGPHKIRWPGQPARDGTWHANFPSWEEFWKHPERDAAPVPAPAAPDRFIDTMRRGERRPIPPDFSWAKR
ncbi:MAG: nuclear transport factor 2 family protein [Gammaproteobacteria bacterium]